MQHEEQPLSYKGFGTNTNGLGILLVTILAVILALFCWNFWKDGSKEKDHYRLTSVAAQSDETGTGENEQPASAEASKEGTQAEAAKAEEAVKAPAIADSSKPADSTKH